MSIARSILFVLLLAPVALSARASLNVDAAPHAGHAAASTLRTTGFNVLIASQWTSAGEKREIACPDNFFRQDANILPRSGGRT